MKVVQADLQIIKDRPTPKRPAKMQRKVLDFYKVKRNDYTGSSPAMCMAVKPTVPSIVDKETSLGYQNHVNKCIGLE